MKKFKTLMMLALGTSLIASSQMVFANTLETSAIAQEVQVSQNVVQSVLQGFGTIKEINNSAERSQIVIELEGQKNSVLALNITNETFLIDNETGYPSLVKDLKVGERIYAYYSPLMTKSIPPQSAAKAIVTNIKENKTPARYFTVGEVIERNSEGLKVLDTDHSIILTILPTTPLSPFMTKQVVSLDDIKEGTSLFAWFDRVALSMPGQATADCVVILPDSMDSCQEKEEVTANEEAVKKIMINGETLNGYEVIFENSKALVPLRPVAEKLGFKVTWNAKDQTVMLDNGQVKTSVQVGKDSYYKASSKAIGLTAPMSFGVAPELIQKTLYVPADLFNLLYSNDETVKIEGDTLFINTNH